MAGNSGAAVIMLTGWGARVDAMDDWQAHVDDILAKPPRLAELRRALSDVKVATP